MSEHESPKKYHFYVDVVGDLAPSRLEDLLTALNTTAEDVRLLGAYPIGAS